MKKFRLLLLLLVLIIIIMGCSSEDKVEKTTYTLLIRKEGQGIVEPGEGEFNYEENAIVSLSATADSSNGWFFDRWGGASGEEVVENKLLMDENKSISAVFSKLEYSLNVNVTPDEAGTVNEEILPALQSIEHGDSVQLTANSNTGYVFDHWEGDLSGSENPATILMDENKNVTAVFVKEQYELNVVVIPEGAGTVEEEILPLYRVLNMEILCV